MPTRPTKPSTSAAKTPPPEPENDSEETAADEAENGDNEEPGADLEEVEEDEEDDAAADLDDDEEEDDDEDEEEEEVVAAPVVRAPARPSPGRPPGAKEEPEPPFFVGERVVLISNTRPRTGSPIADHPVGATGRVETVLSQTAIVRFDRAPDIKEVVAFTCLDSLDDEAKARRAERDRLAAAKTT